MVTEARRSPRYARQLDVDIDGLELVTTNVAMGGVQLCCPEMRFSGFHNAHKDGEVTLKIKVPGCDRWVTIRGVTRYANPCDDEYLIGLEFTGFDEDAEIRWAAYLDTLAAAKPTA